MRHAPRGGDHRIHELAVDGDGVVTWVKLDDHFDEHPKQLRVSALGTALWVKAMAYCNRQPPHDGFISIEKVMTYRDRDMKQPLKIAERLVEARCWDLAEGGFRVHDYHDYQLTADDLEEQRQQHRADKVAGGRARAASAQRSGGKFTSSTSGTDAAGTSGSPAVPAAAGTSGEPADQRPPAPVPVPVSRTERDSPPGEVNAPLVQPVPADSEATRPRHMHGEPALVPYVDAWRARFSASPQMPAVRRVVDALRADGNPHAKILAHLRVYLDPLKNPDDPRYLSFDNFYAKFGIYDPDHPELRARPTRSAADDWAATVAEADRLDAEARARA